MDPMWKWFEEHEEAVFRVALQLARLDKPDIESSLAKIRPPSLAMSAQRAPGYSGSYVEHRSHSSALTPGPPRSVPMTASNFQSASFPPRPRPAPMTGSQFQSGPFSDTVPQAPPPPRTVPMTGSQFQSGPFSHVAPQAPLLPRLASESESMSTSFMTRPTLSKPSSDPNPQLKPHDPLAPVANPLPRGYSDGVMRSEAGYEKEFEGLDKMNTGGVDGDIVVEHFKKSKLTLQDLGNIWMQVDGGDKGYLNKEEFVRFCLEEAKASKSTT